MKPILLDVVEAGRRSGLSMTNQLFTNWEKWKDKASQLGYRITQSKNTSDSGQIYTYWTAFFPGKKRPSTSDLGGEFSTYNQKGWLYAGMDIP